MSPPDKLPEGTTAPSTAPAAPTEGGVSADASDIKELRKLPFGACEYFS